MTHLLHFYGELPFSSADFLKTTFNANTVSYLEQHMDAETYRLELLEASGPRWLRAVRVAPNVSLPWWAARALGATRISYLETTTHEVGTHTLEWNALSNVLTERVHMTGQIQLEAAPRGTCRYTLQGEVSVQFYGIGARLEEAIGESVTRTFELTHELLLIRHAAHQRGNLL